MSLCWSVVLQIVWQYVRKRFKEPPDHYKVEVHDQQASAAAVSRLSTFYMHASLG